jgi:RNA polymerase sigma-70 factor, ECF subfamily
VAPEERDRLVDTFMRAVRSHDVTALAQVLASDAVALADGGGKITAVPRPLHGNALIARTFIGFAQLPASRGWRLVPTMVNGLPGCLIVDDLAGGRSVQTIALALRPTSRAAWAHCTSSATRTNCARSRNGYIPECHSARGCPV